MLPRATLLLAVAGTQSALVANRPISPYEMQSLMGVGINLGNQLDKMNTKKLPTESFIADFHAANFSNVRIPVRWDKHTSKSAPYTIDEKWMQAVENTVDWCLSRGMVCVVNTHHETWIDVPWPSGFKKELPRLVAIWKQVGERFASKGEKLVFEMFNEPHLMSIDNLNELYAQVLPVIRSSNPTRIVMFQGLKFANPSWLVANGTQLNIPDDKYLMLQIHNYDPWDYAGSSPTKFSWGSDADVQVLKKWVQAVDAWAKQRKLPIYYGEWATTTQQTAKTGRYTWYAAHYDAIMEQGWAAAVWSDGGEHMLYDYKSRKWDTAILKALGRVVPGTSASTVEMH